MNLKLRRAASMSTARRRGGALIIAIVTLLVITSTMAALIQSLMAEFRQSRQTAIELQAHTLADAALARAAAQLRNNSNYQGETWRAAAANPNDPATTGIADIRIETTRDKTQIIIEARYPDHPTRRVLASRKLLIP